MSFPVDILNSCSHEQLKISGENYVSGLRCGNPNHPEFLSLPDHSKVRTCKYLSPSFLDTLVDLKDLKYPVHNY